MSITRKYVIALGMLLLTVVPTLATTTFQLFIGSTPASLSLSSLANNTRSSPSTMYDPRQGQTGQGYLTAVVECVLTFAAAPTAGTAVPIAFLKSGNGTNFEDTTTSRVPNVSCPVTAGQTTTRVSFDNIRLPAWRFQIIALNDGTGQTITTGTITVTPTTMQGN